MTTIIHVKTARVYGHNDDMTAKVEKVTVKLEAGYPFNNFLENMHLKGYLGTQKPEVVKVITRKNHKEAWKDTPDSIEEYQALINKQIEKTKPVQKVDYKLAFEKEKARNEEILSRLEALEAERKEEPVININKPEQTDEGDEITIDIEALPSKNMPELKEIAKALNEQSEANIDVSQNKAELIEAIKNALNEAE